MHFKSFDSSYQAVEKCRSPTFIRNLYIIIIRNACYLHLMRNATFFTCLSFFLLFSLSTTTYAQSFYGLNFQGLHTFSLTVALDDRGHIGFGYNYRDFNPSMGNAVLDWQVELQASHDLKAFKLSGGMNYLNLDNDFQNNLGLGLGAHAYIQTDARQDDGNAYVGLDLSAYPGYFNNRLSFAPKIGYRVGTLLNSGLGDGEDASASLTDNSAIGASINLNHNHLYLGALTDASFTPNFPSRFSLGIDAEVYRRTLFDAAEDVKEDEEGQQFWLQARISTSF